MKINPKTFESYWQEHYGKEAMKRIFSGQGTNTNKFGDVDLDGVERQNTLNNIRSTYKEINGRDINEDMLANLSTSDLREFSSR